MNRITIAMLGILITSGCGRDQARQQPAAGEWVVAEGTVGDSRLIVRARASLPPAHVRKRLPWLVTIDWPYEPVPGGMPPEEDNQRMIQFEDLLEMGVEKPDRCLQFHSVTGGGKRQWEYYIRDRDEFTKDLNGALRGHPKFPISITFYSDPEWQAFADLLEELEEK
jgi:hypothetical protein